MPGFSDHEFAEFCRSAWPVTPVILLFGDLIYMMDYAEESTRQRVFVNPTKRPCC